MQLHLSLLSLSSSIHFTLHLPLHPHHNTTTMRFITNLLLVLLSACALAAPPMDPAKSEGRTLNDIFRSLGVAQAKHVKEAKKAALIAAESDSSEKPANRTAEAKRPTTTCTYQVNYKMNTYYLFGDNWNATKDTIKASCEKGRSRVLNHWSYREWQDQNGTHFCAKVSCACAVLVRSSG
jgi:hypothetical protein